MFEYYDYMLPIKKMVTHYFKNLNMFNVIVL
jgi:hypothetical protein